MWLLTRCVLAVAPSGDVVASLFNVVTAEDLEEEEEEEEEKAFCLLGLPSAPIIGVPLFARAPSAPNDDDEVTSEEGVGGRSFPPIPA